MFRLIAVLLLVCATAHADPAPLVPSPNFHQNGAEKARGAVVWLHGAYDSTAMPPPPEPGLIPRLADRGFDVWRFNRRSGQDALAAGADALARGLNGLRRIGYRRIIVAGFSRGGWIALSALTHDAPLDAVIALSPAAHGTRPERQQQALTEWTSLWRAVRAQPARVVLVQLRDDPYDPDPALRRDIATADGKRAGMRLLSIYRPRDPTGHMGTEEPVFDQRFGAGIVDFVDPRPR